MAGENQIRIVFRSVFQYIENYEYEENKEIHYVPCGGMKGNQLIRKTVSIPGSRLRSRHWRKKPCNEKDATLYWIKGTRLFCMILGDYYGFMRVCS